MKFYRDESGEELRLDEKEVGEALRMVLDCLLDTCPKEVGEILQVGAWSLQVGESWRGITREG